VGFKEITFCWVDGRRSHFACGKSIGSFGGFMSPSRLRFTGIFRILRVFLYLIAPHTCHRAHGRKLAVIHLMRFGLFGWHVKQHVSISTASKRRSPQSSDSISTPDNLTERGTFGCTDRSLQLSETNGFMRIFSVVHPNVPPP